MALRWTDNSLSKFVRFGPKDTRVDRQRGRSDGSRDSPQSDAAELSAYEHEIVAQGNAALAQFRKQQNDELDRLNGERQQLRHERDDGYRASRDRLQGELDAELDALKRTAGPDSAKIAGPRQHLFDATQRVERLELELRRDLRVHFARSYIPIMIALSLLEVPVNRLAFEFFFEESPELSLALAAGVGVILLLIAHFVGLLVRRFPNLRSTVTRILSGLVILVLAAVAIFAIYVIALLRQHFVDFLDREAGVDISSLLASGDIGDIATTLASVTLGSAGYTLLAINLMIFALGALFAFYRHDPHPDYETAVRRKQKYQRALAAAQMAFERDAAAIDRRFSERISFLDQRIDQIEAQISELDGKIQTVAESGPEALALVRGVTQQKVFAYQAGNEETRKARSPVYFGARTIEMVAELVALPE